MHSLCAWPSREFSPTAHRWASVIFLLIKTCLILEATRSAFARARHNCHPIGPLKENYVVTGGLHQRHIRRLGRTKSFLDCVKLLCTQKRGNYAFYMNGICYGMYCMDRGRNICRVKKHRSVKSELIRIGRGNVTNLASHPKKRGSKKRRNTKKTSNNIWNRPGLFIIKPSLLQHYKTNKHSLHNHNASSGGSDSKAISHNKSNKSHDSGAKVSLEIKFTTADLMQANLFLGDSSSNKSNEAKLDKKNIKKGKGSRGIKSDEASLGGLKKYNKIRNTNLMMLSKDYNLQESRTHSKRSIRTHQHYFDNSLLIDRGISRTGSRKHVYSSARTSRDFPVQYIHIPSTNTLSPNWRFLPKSNNGKNDIEFSPAILVDQSQDKLFGPSVRWTDKREKIAFHRTSSSPSDVISGSLPLHIPSVSKNPSLTILPSNSFAKEVNDENEHDIILPQDQTIARQNSMTTSRLLDMAKNSTLIALKPSLSPPVSNTGKTLIPLPPPPLLKQSNSTGFSSFIKTSSLSKNGYSGLSNAKGSSSTEAYDKLGNVEFDLNNQMELHSTPLIEIRGKITSNGTILPEDGASSSSKAGNAPQESMETPNSVDEAINIPAQNAIVAFGIPALSTKGKTHHKRLGNNSQASKNADVSSIDIPLPARLKIQAPAENIVFIDQGLSKASKLEHTYYSDVDKDKNTDQKAKSMQITRQSILHRPNQPLNRTVISRILETVKQDNERTHLVGHSKVRAKSSSGLHLREKPKTVNKDWKTGPKFNTKTSTKAVINNKVNYNKRLLPIQNSQLTRLLTKPGAANAHLKKANVTDIKGHIQHNELTGSKINTSRHEWKNVTSFRHHDTIPLNHIISNLTVAHGLRGINTLTSSPIVIDFFRPRQQPKTRTYGNGRQQYNRTVYVKLTKTEYHHAGCNSPIGLSSGSITDGQMSASSQLSDDFAPWKGRIRLSPERADDSNAWCADPNKLSEQQYLQIDLGSKQVICKVATQGDQRTPNWVKSFMLSYSMDGQRWHTYMEGGVKKIFLGNKEQDDTTSKELTRPMTARFIRFLPKRWRGNTICMRVELFNRTEPSHQQLSERSTIPSSTGLIDYLTFEKQDDNIALDSTALGNNAFLNKGATIYDTHSSCRHAVRIQKGSDILLDGRNMRVKPKTAITISLWARLDRVEGVHSLFDTIGSHSLHKQGQFHFEIIGGAVRWFHRNETADEIFNVITDPRVLPANVWTHLAATYDAQTSKAQIYINGSLFAEALGQGLLSQDWDGRIGIGRHKDVRDLNGDIDEFMIFNKAIPLQKIKQLARKCYFGKYYCGSTLVAERGLLVSPEYPAFHRGPVECIWDIEAEPDEIVILNIKEFDVTNNPNCISNTFEVRDGESDTKIGKYCGVTPPPRIESHGNHMWVRYSTNDRNIQERFKIEYSREKKRSSKKTMERECHGSDVMENVTLIGGPKAGNYTDLGPADSMVSCIGRCCKKEFCDLGFMIDGNCYGVHCASQDLCRIRKARPSNLHPMISFISRAGIPARVRPLMVMEKAIGTTSDNGSGGGESDTLCPHTDVHKNVTLTGGLRAGNFTSYGKVAAFSHCIAMCCKADNCDAAFMVKDTCFGVKCASDRLCAFKKAKNSPYSPTLSYMLKPKTEHPAQSPGTSKSIVDRRAKACGNSRISRVYRDVTLKGGINAGDFTDRGQVNNMDDCIAHCCSDESCNLAFVIKNTCFTVKCKSYDTCGLKAAASEFYNPRIAYVNWNPPRENIGQGILHYSYMGCWRDFDMSAFAIPLLEGTDSRLNNPYKRRDDPVNDCSMVAQSHGYTVFAIQNGGACFSGRNSEQTYKRYGSSDACKGGRGGPFANSVYRLFEDGSIMSLGCWADLQDRAFRRLEKMDQLLQDNYQKRSDPVGTCAKVAMKFKLRTFALQKGGQCFLSKEDNDAYIKYGPSRKCRYGLGGQMANDVYVLNEPGNATANRGSAPSNNRTMMSNATSILHQIQNVTKNTTVKDMQRNELLPGETVYKEELTDKEHVIYVYTPGEVLNNVTLSSGINAGTFVDKGKLTSMDECIKGCGETPQCDVAFMLGRQCFAVDCYGDNVCNTKQAFSSFYNPRVAFVKHRVIRQQRFKGPPTPSSKGKEKCVNYRLLENVTLIDGINAGNFSDLGHVTNMNDCIDRCCVEPTCEIAFKIEDDCYGVNCYSKESCKTRPARNSGVFHPYIAFMKEITDKKSAEHESKSKESRPKDSSATKSNCSSAVWGGEVRMNQTLVGGINAGEFTDHGQTDTIGDCMSHCCSEKNCDLAFMIDKDCYTVHCKGPDVCKTRQARPTKFHPMIAFKKPYEIGLTNIFADIKSILTELTNDYQKYIEEDLLQEHTYNIQRDIPLTSNTTLMTKKPTRQKTTRTIIPHPFYPEAPPEVPTTSETTEANDKGNKATQSTSEDTHNGKCEASSIVHNATLKMGMHSGVFTKLGRVKDMAECIKRCCRSANADVAYVLGSMCFAVKCFSQELCKTVPVMMSLIGNLNINPSLSFLKKTGPEEASQEVTSSTDNDFDELIDLAIDEDQFLATLVYNNTLTGSHTKSDLDTTSKLRHGKAKQGRKLKSSYGIVQGEDSTGYKSVTYGLGMTHGMTRGSQNSIDRGTGKMRFPITHPRTDDLVLLPVEASSDNLYQMCLDSPVTYNVTLRGGINAGNFTEQGEGLTTKECIGKCCDTSQCDLAFMFGDRCYSVACANEGVCQAVLAKPSNLEPKVAYVTKNRNLDYNNEGITFAVTNDDDSTCKAPKLRHGPVYINKSLVGGMEAGNYTYLGKSRSMDECLSKSCEAKSPDLAYMIDDDCFGVRCFSQDLCKVSNVNPQNGIVQISEIKKSINRPSRNHVILSYILIGVSGFGMCIAAIFWAICFYLKRQSRLPSKDELETGQTTEN